MVKKTVEVLGRKVTKEGNAITSLTVDDLTVAELVECKEGFMQVEVTVQEVKEVSEGMEDVTYSFQATDEETELGKVFAYTWNVRTNVSEVGSYQNKIGQKETLYVLATVLEAHANEELVLVAMNINHEIITEYVSRERIAILRSIVTEEVLREKPVLLRSKGFIYSNAFLETEYGQENQHLDKTVEERYARELPTIRNYDMHGRKLLDTKREN
ncbi:hypothetical protein [Bacillus thuringiensis]|uniref:hypothetical protein n=1 Tax=Bacillus thuringiensis TaxID=1428 RepID=UPI000BFE627A|nr:hypothetical protein [Bacillus thuringiensis]PGT89978.1 hypothetical protein COD17_09520 [Bacillus thuringiensis]